MSKVNTGRGKWREESGVSFTELIVVFFIFSILGLMVYDLLVGTARTNLFIEANNDLSEFGQRMVNEIKTQVLQSKRLLDNTTAGIAYQDALEMSGAPEPIDSTQLAKIEMNGSFAPSLTGHPETPFETTSVGNALLFAEAVTPYLDETDDTRIDIYRFNYYYLSKNTEVDFLELDHILEVEYWESIQFADYNQLTRLLYRDDEGVALAAALSGLQTEDTDTGRPVITMAWDPDADADEAFYNYSGSSTLPESPDSSYQIEMASIQPAITHLTTTRIGGKMPYTVAFNSGESFDIGHPVPVFATADTAGDGFPNGMEVMLAGPTGGRKIFIRLVLAADCGSARVTSRENVVLINARDY